MTRVTQEEIQARLYLVEPRILVFREFPKPSESTFSLVDDRLHALTSNLPHFCLVIDVREVASRPTAKMRAVAHQQLEELGPKIRFVAGVTGGVLFRKIMLKFALGFILKKPHNLCVTLEEGIEACQAFWAAQS